jgi:hypothetical protein
MYYVFIKSISNPEQLFTNLSMTTKNQAHPLKINLIIEFYLFKKKNMNYNFKHEYITTNR